MCFAESISTIVLRNKRIHRSIDLTSQLVYISHNITIENVGNVDAKTFEFVPEPNMWKKLAYIEAWDLITNTKLKLVEATYKRIESGKYFLVVFEKPVRPASSVRIQVDTIYTRHLSSQPRIFTYNEPELLVYEGNLYFYSPYYTVVQTLHVIMPSKNVSEFSYIEPVHFTDAVIHYGPYNDIGPFSVESISVYYENAGHFLVATNVERTIIASHWSFITVNEVIDLKHTGATFKGNFRPARAEYYKTFEVKPNYVQSFYMTLPASATNIRYYDEIGNISTSQVSILHDSVLLKLKLRYPLFGGWKIQYFISYNVPTYEYLYKVGHFYLLKMRLIDYILHDMVVERLTTKIILPEGSTNVTFRPPYPVDVEQCSFEYLCLDPFGRPSIIVKKQNLIEEHIEDFEIKYIFSEFNLLLEPVLLIAYIYLLFVGIIVCIRCTDTFQITNKNEFRKICKQE